MRKFLFVLILTSCVRENIKAPIFQGKTSIDYYHGVKVVDPYRNLENLEDTLVLNWLKDQNNYATQILNSIPNQERLVEKQKSYYLEDNYSIIRSRQTADGKFFLEKLAAGDTISKLYYRKDRSARDSLLFDPNDFKSESKTSLIINYFKPDRKGENIAVSLSKKGEEISKIIVLNVESGKPLPIELTNARPSIGGIQWLPDGSGFTYIYHPNINPQDPNYGLNCKSVFFNIKNYAKDLEEVFSRKTAPEVKMNPEDYPKIYIYGGSKKYIFGQISGSSRFKDMYYKKIEDLLFPNISWKPLYNKSDKIEKIRIANNEIYFLSAKDNPNYQIYRTSLINPDFTNAKPLIKGEKNNVITDLAVNNDGLYYVRVKNGVEAKLYLYSDKKENEIRLPKTSGSIRISSTFNKKEILHVYCVGWLEQGTSYEFDFSKNEFKNVNLIPNLKSTEFDNYIVKELEIESHDGEKVPLSIIHKKDIQMNGSNPTLFYGYGSYGGPGNPFYSPNLLTWVSEGGILAVAHVRGGGEKGDSWYRDGVKLNKPNTWKDMIACTEFMINNRYTSSENSVIIGSSAGGIMAGRAVTERPDLYKAAILVSPAMNMLRSEVQPNGKNSIKEFGTVEIKEEFEALLKMDSYHSLKENTKYPATLITAGVKDGRVVVWDPAKFAARLQESNISENPILFSVDFESGHGAMNNYKEKIYNTYAQMFSFAFWQTGHPDYQPKD